MAQKKYNSLEPEVSKWTYISIIAFIVIMLGLVIGLQPSNSERIYDSYKFVASTEFTEDHPFYEVTYKNTLFKKGLDKILEQEEVMFLFIGYNGCAPCNAHIGPVQKYFFEENVDDVVDRIYYFNAINNEKDFYALFDNLVGVTENTPQLLLIVDGQIVQSFTVKSADDVKIINGSVKDFFQDALEYINKP